ncbi:MAG: SPOR domain-containing protein [Nitrospinaceae bacterium]
MVFLGIGFHAGGLQAVSPPPARSYVLQVNAFRDWRNAERFTHALSAKGYEAFIAAPAREGLYKVRVGPVPSWKSAQNLARRLQREEGLASMMMLFVPPGGPAPQTIKGLERPPPLIKSSESKPRSAPDAAAASSAKTSPSPAMQAASSDVVDAVVARFLAWKTALEKRDLQEYFTFYSPSFDSGLESLETWKRSRLQEWTRRPATGINIREVEIRPAEGGLEMRFIQETLRGRDRKLNRKTLVWRREGGSWKIILERGDPA